MRWVLVLLIGLIAVPAFAQDTGTRASEAELLALGPDVAATVGPPALAAPSAVERERITDDISSRVRCPVCQGMAVADSPSESARNMKHQVRALVAAGYDESQILAYFESSYGEFIRLVPRAEGFNLIVWLLPLAMFAVGLLFVAGFLRSMRGTEEPPAPVAGEATPEQEEEDPWIAQVRRELSDV